MAKDTFEKELLHTAGDNQPNVFQLLFRYRDACSIV